MRGRTVILVSHHVQLCAPGASYIVALDNGRVQFSGDRDAFKSSGVMAKLVQSTNEHTDEADENAEAVIEDMPQVDEKDSLSVVANGSDTSSTIAPPTPVEPKVAGKPPRKLVEEEARATGRISADIWKTYIWACGDGWYWTLFIGVLVVAALSPVIENGWLK